ncbi:hypothetical protein PR002_g29610 [Phytophthora rubi]|uniref:Secreted protein n=1 Tax=Phytophthora rubi TaxID=129364 RepID=A0A6A3GZ78_9STRA|nr:hypothetical protein PR002_g29610 [Phytophthora rubi]
MWVLCGTAATKLVAAFKPRMLSCGCPAAGACSRWWYDVPESVHTNRAVLCGFYVVQWRRRYSSRRCQAAIAWRQDRDVHVAHGVDEWQC